MSIGHAGEHEVQHQVPRQAVEGQPASDVFGQYGVGVTCASAMILFLAIAAIDKLTGVELRLQIFYLIPVAMVTWAAGRFWGLLSSVGITAAWVLMFGAIHTYTRNFYFYWDAAASLATLIAFVLLLARLRSALRTDAPRSG
jgi:hypothetical protein